MNYLFIHCTEITCNFTKPLKRLTITAIYHGGRNCHVDSTQQKEKCCFTNQNLQTRRVDPYKHRPLTCFCWNHCVLNHVARLWFIKHYFCCAAKLHSNPCSRLSRTKVPWFHTTLTCQKNALLAIGGICNTAVHMCYTSQFLLLPNKEKKERKRRRKGQIVNRTWKIHIIHTLITFNKHTVKSI